MSYIWPPKEKCLSEESHVCFSWLNYLLIRCGEEGTHAKKLSFKKGSIKNQTNINSRRSHDYNNDDNNKDDANDDDDDDENNYNNNNNKSNNNDNSNNENNDNNTNYNCKFWL